MGKVYVTQESLGKNLEPAKKFGEIYLILRHNETNGPTCDYEKVLRRLETVLEQFDPDADLLLNLGEPHATGLAYALVLNKSRGHFRLLKWMRRTQEYVASEVDVDW